MRITWTWIGIVLLVFIACMSFLLYLLAQGAVMSIPLILLIWGTALCGCGLVGCRERRKAKSFAARRIVSTSKREGIQLIERPNLLPQVSCKHL
jgi:hypothetical protein